MHGATVGGHLHHLGAAAERRHREAGAQRLGQHRQVGIDPEQLLGAAAGDAIARQHLVEDQQAAGRRWSARAHPLEVARGRHDRPAVTQDRFGDDRRDLLAVPLEQRFQRRGVVPRCDQQG